MLIEFLFCFEDVHSLSCKTEYSLHSLCVVESEGILHLYQRQRNAETILCVDRSINVRSVDRQSIRFDQKRKKRKRDAGFVVLTWIFGLDEC